MAMHEKSYNAKLFFCPSAGCRVVTFKTDPICPSCKGEGVAVREAVSSTTHRIRSTALSIAVDGRKIAEAVSSHRRR